MTEDRRYLITRGRIFYVQIATPMPLHGRYRKLVQKSLKTDSLREAQARRWAVINGYKTAWQRADESPTMTAEQIDQIAEEEIAKEKARDSAWP